MLILVVNCGSTSIKLSLIDSQSESTLATEAIERIGGKGGATHAEALRQRLPAFLSEFRRQADGRQAVAAVGHRVVHGGELFSAPAVIDDAALAAIDQLSQLAPLHNPANAEGIRAARELMPDLPHVAVFDTAFHATLPRRARAYALPHCEPTAGGSSEAPDSESKPSDEFSMAEQPIRRYGFHGTSHQFVAERAAAFLDEDVRNLRLISCHLGGGCSVCAIENGRSVETSMGMTPLEGLVMATRAGDIDAGVLLHLMRTESMTVDELDHLLNRQSGLKGLSGRTGDMRDIEQAAADGDEASRLAIQVFCHRVRKYVGAYAVAMGGVDAIVFTAGIGENSATVRHRVSQRLEFLGARLDEDANRAAVVDGSNPVVAISEPHSRVKLLVAAADEMLAIARRTHVVCQSANPPESERSIPVAISARHVHLTQATVEALFGDGYQLTSMRPLSQPGQFAANEVVSLVGPKRTLEGVRVLGPTRRKDQVEISRTDEFYLGIDAPVRASGDVENSPGIKLIGTEGRSLTLKQGVICAWRHIHMTPEDAAHFGVLNGDVVEVQVGHGRGRSLTFGDVLVRVKSRYKLEMHIDTDEGNAAELQATDAGDLNLKAVLRR